MLSLSRTHDCDLITRVSKVGQICERPFPQLGLPRSMSVAIDGETVVIGAYTRNYTQPEEAGVVFVGRIP